MTAPQQTLPHDLTAEVDALGSALWDADAAGKVVSRLDRDMFYRTAHATVFDAITAVSNRGETVDVVTVLDELAEQGVLDHVGGVAAVHDLHEHSHIPAWVDSYIGKVQDAARKRRLHTVGAKLARGTLEGEDTEQLVSEAATTLQEQETLAPSTGLADPDELAARLIRRIAEGPEDRWGTNLEISSTFDRIFSAKRGKLVTWVGAPSHGKSTLIDVALLTLIDAGWNTAVYSPEKTGVDGHLEDLIHSHVGRDPRSAPSDDVDRAMRDILNSVRFIEDPPDRTAEGILAAARHAERDLDGLDLLVIDPWNKLRHPNSDYARPDLYLQEALGQLVLATRNRGWAVWVAAHPTKLPLEEGCDSRVKAPAARDLSGGAEWWNQSDAILSVWRDHTGERDDPAEARVTTEKIKQDGDWGRMGCVCRIRFDETRRRFYGLTDRQDPQQQF